MVHSCLASVATCPGYHTCVEESRTTPKAAFGSGTFQSLWIADAGLIFKQLQFSRMQKGSHMRNDSMLFAHHAMLTPSLYMQGLLHELPVRSTTQVQQVLTACAQPCIAPVARFNATAQPATPDKCLHELFEEHAASHPGARCLLLGGETMGYGQVNIMADVVASRLLAHGMRSLDVIGVALFRSFELYAALLGVLKAGGVCLALDPDAPQERKALLLSSAGARLLLSAGSALGQLDTLPNDAQPQVCSQHNL